MHRRSIGLPKNGAVRVAMLAALVLGAILARSTRRGLQLVHPTRSRVTAEEVTRARAEIPGLEDVTLHTADGLALRAWFSPGVRGAVVILVHGLFGNRMSLEPDARVFARHGYGVLLFDSRASGDSQGSVACWGDRDQLDARAAVDYALSRPEIDPSRVGMLGFSVGGSTVALESSQDSRVRAVILYATWTSLDREIRTNHRQFGPLSWGPILLVMRSVGIDPRHVTPLEHIAAISPRPLLMITGTADTDTPVSVMQQLFQRAGEPKDLWIVENAVHGGYRATAPAEYETRVISFLDRAFSGHVARHE
jgi:alpha-beta hydrolase superfamily lysophospholipase